MSGRGQRGRGRGRGGRRHLGGEGEARDQGARARGHPTLRYPNGAPSDHFKISSAPFREKKAPKHYASSSSRATEPLITFQYGPNAHKATVPRGSDRVKALSSRATHVHPKRVGALETLIPLHTGPLHCSSRGERRGLTFWGS